MLFYGWHAHFVINLTVLSCNVESKIKLVWNSAGLHVKRGLVRAIRVSDVAGLSVGEQFPKLKTLKLFEFYQKFYKISIYLSPTNWKFGYGVDGHSHRLGSANGLFVSVSLVIILLNRFLSFAVIRWWLDVIKPASTTRVRKKPPMMHFMINF